MPKVSICVPIHSSMKYGDYFLWRLVQSIMTQSFKDYELIITQEGSMPVNTNAAMKKARGEIIKILYMDDYFAHDNALKLIVDAFGKNTQWLATGCLHQRHEKNLYEDPHSPHFPKYTEDIFVGNNQIGSPSVIALRNEGHFEFDEELSWLLDCDIYYRYYRKYGDPTIIEDLNVVLGIGDHQATHTLSNKQKIYEQNYLLTKYP